jgi:hypothetical protein
MTKRHGNINRMKKVLDLELILANIMLTIGGFNILLNLLQTFLLVVFHTPYPLLQRPTSNAAHGQTYKMGNYTQCFPREARSYLGYLQDETNLRLVP